MTRVMSWDACPVDVPRIVEAPARGGGLTLV
jgi:hypothetical protein